MLEDHCTELGAVANAQATGNDKTEDFVCGIGTLTLAFSAFHKVYNEVLFTLQRADLG